MNTHPLLNNPCPTSLRLEVKEEPPVADCNSQGQVQLGEILFLKPLAASLAFFRRMNSTPKIQSHGLDCSLAAKYHPFCYLSYRNVSCHYDVVTF